MAYIFTSPGEYIQGKGEIKNIGKYAGKFGTNLLVLVDQYIYDNYKDLIDLNTEHNVYINYVIVSDECTYAEMEKAKNAFTDYDSDVVIGVGGGKTLDIAKGTSAYCDSPLVIVPTIASQDAPCSRISVVYKENGEFDSFMTHKKNPDIVLVDSMVIAKAPARMLAAGMGDGLSTLFESRACVASGTKNTAGGLPTNTAPMLARFCYQIIMENGIAAYRAVENNVVTKALDNVIEANIYLSGLGGEDTGDAGAHGMYDALTILPECHAYLHGELVSFGILVQLVLENESAKVINEILDFNEAVGLPVCLADIGVDKTNTEALWKVAKAACEDTLQNMPFPVTAEDVYAAVIVADSFGSDHKKA